MSTPLLEAWRAAAEKASVAEQAVFTKTVDAIRPIDLPTQAELANAVLLRLKASELLQRCLDDALRQGRRAASPPL
jgi:hypothetical protein